MILKKNVYMQWVGLYDKQGYLPAMIEVNTVWMLVLHVLVCACVCVCVRMYRGVFGDTHTLHLR